ncbi:hypothetical protein DL764_001775 [Monosporascus ibericus]|uniref:(4-O-methyl)-D-glucuronate--lignin esterase n=1 Tax=Monosporascus ibericus TaxID=155417 RepID=A0A4Q4TRJ8_9PEZI|nr:hypothetical protein DL764_001775 [Monosporascus ibericus]
MLLLIPLLLLSVTSFAQELAPATCDVRLPSSFPPIPTLPDPFQLVNGTAVADATTWSCRRAEIRAMLEQYELGVKPPKASFFEASMSGNSITIRCGEDGKSISFTATIRSPSGGDTGPFPAIIALGGTFIPIPPGIALITYNNEQMAATNPGGEDLFFQLYSTQIGGLMGWAWGVSRILDALDILGPETTNIDPTRVGVTGCSRNGKGALVAGAFDDRIALTIPQEGGSGGPGCWRLAA